MDSTSGSAVSRTYVPPGEGPAYWVGNTEFVTLKLTGSETSGAFAVVELVAMPGAEPPPHIHHRTDETYYLLEGELAVLDGKRTYTATAGAIVHLPKGTLHAWRNATTQPARALLLITRPASRASSPRWGCRGRVHPHPHRLHRRPRGGCAADAGAGAKVRH